MAKPDLDDGWLPYAHELDAALAAADFTKGARIVLREVFGQIFGIGPVGKTKPRPASLSPSDIARRTGMLKRQVVRSIEDLVLCHVLKRIDRGLYSFVKDYERWTRPDGSPRLSKVEVAYCASAATLAKTYISGPAYAQNTGAQIDPKRQKLGAQIDPDWGRRLTPTGGANGPQLGAQIDPENASPYRIGRAELKREIEGRQASQAGGHGERNGYDSVSPIEDLIAQAGSIFNGKIAAVVQSHAGDIIEKLGDRLDCYLAALRQASRAKSTIRDLHAFCMSEARKYIRTGIPPEPVSVEPTSSPASSKSKLQDDAFARAAAQLPDPEGD